MSSKVIEADAGVHSLAMAVAVSRVMSSPLPYLTLHIRSPSPVGGSMVSGVHVQAAEDRGR